VAGKSADNSGPSSGKRRGRPENLKPFKKGQSGNPGGRPKNRESITYWLREFGNMTPGEIAKRCRLWADELKRGGDDLPLFALVALRALMALANEPDASLMGKVQDRVEGKLPTTIRTWQDEVIELLRSGTVEPAAVWEELGSDLARELFIAAGIPLAADREAQAAAAEAD
jgi:hypothetical protein